MTALSGGGEDVGMKIGIVCGYGIVPDERLVAYVRRVVACASAQQLDTLVLCGGRTVRGVEQTDAATLRDLLGEDAARFQIVLEEASISTLHNLLYARQRIAANRMPVESLSIFCDTLRFMKVFCLSKILFRAYPTRVIGVYRREPFWMYALQIPFTLLQCAGALCPSLERLQLRIRRLMARSQD